MSDSLADYQRQFASHMARADWPKAAETAAACRLRFPESPIGWLLGSFVALSANDKAQALALADGGLAVAASDFQCQLQRAESLLALGRRPEAVQAADSAAHSQRDIPAALDAVGTFLVHASEHERALAMYDQAVALAPTERRLRARRAMVLRYLGHFDRAKLDYDTILASNPNDAEALKARGELRLLQPDHTSIVEMEAALATQTDPEQNIALHFALAKAYGDNGDHPTSWRHLSAGNNLQRTQLRYDTQQDREIFERIMAGFPTVESAHADTTGESPIFILGLPRSGTTLVERILGSHSQVHAAGELAALSSAVGAAINDIQPMEQLDWVDFANLLGRAEGKTIAQGYLTEARAWRGTRPRFIDKQPTNFFYCGLILRAFPKARIVHLTRHPLAATYAIYKTRFRRTYPFSYDLVELADFIIGYRRLMAHWHQVLPGRILDVAYEDMVQSQEPSTRRLLDHCDLTFEDACLQFHKNPAASTTASAVQVRQPIYDSSLHEWRHHAEALRPARARFEAAGISVD